MFNFVSNLLLKSFWFRKTMVRISDAFSFMRTDAQNTAYVIVNYIYLNHPEVESISFCIADEKYNERGTRQVIDWINYRREGHFCRLSSSTERYMDNILHNKTNIDYLFIRYIDSLLKEIPDTIKESQAYKQKRASQDAEAASKALAAAKEFRNKND